jgi:hypothetical protein
LNISLHIFIYIFTSRLPQQRGFGVLGFWGFGVSVGVAVGVLVNVPVLVGVLVGVFVGVSGVVSKPNTT